MLTGTKEAAETDGTDMDRLKLVVQTTCIVLSPGPSALFLKQGQEMHRVAKELLGLKT